MSDEKKTFTVLFDRLSSKYWNRPEVRKLMNRSRYIWNMGMYDELLHDLEVALEEKHITKTEYENLLQLFARRIGICINGC